MGGLYETEGILQIILVTGVIGGGAAWLAGRAIALTWRPYWHCLVYMAILGGGVRFMHFALFGDNLVSLPSYLADAIFVMAVASVSFRMTRARQMAQHYPWLYERSGPFNWRERGPAA